jgi:glycosyltransferase involved in cell wall biosynthesis
VEEVSFGDLGLTRNAGAKAAQGDWLAFFDGDDLWGEDWLCLALDAATAPDAPQDAIWHPELVYFFSEGDFDRHSLTSRPHPAAQSHYMLHQAGDAPGFDRDLLLLQNVWTANVFCRQNLHLRHPYKAVDRMRGFGIEDWSWYLETLKQGISHRVVADTVQLHRIKEVGSLGEQNRTEGLLKYLPD